MRGSVERFAHASNIRLNACRSFIMGRKHCFDAMTCIGFQDCLIFSHRQAIAPRSFNNFQVQAMTLTHINPAMREHTVARDEDLIANGQRVGQRRFPTTCTSRWENIDMRFFGFQNAANAIKTRV